MKTPEGKFTSYEDWIGIEIFQMGRRSLEDCLKNIASSQMGGFNEYYDKHAWIGWAVCECRDRFEGQKDLLLESGNYNGIYDIWNWYPNITGLRKPHICSDCRPEDCYTKHNNPTIMFPYNRRSKIKCPEGMLVFRIADEYYSLRYPWQIAGNAYVRCYTSGSYPSGFPICLSCLAKKYLELKVYLWDGPRLSSKETHFDFDTNKGCKIED